MARIGLNSCPAPGSINDHLLFSLPGKLLPAVENDYTIMAKNRYRELLAWPLTACHYVLPKSKRPATVTPQDARAALPQNCHTTETECMAEWPIRPYHFGNL